MTPRALQWMRTRVRDADADQEDVSTTWIGLDEPDDLRVAILKGPAYCCTLNRIGKHRGKKEAK